MLVLIHAAIPRLRKGEWSIEEIDYSYNGEVLSIETPPLARVGNFPTKDAVLLFIRENLRGVILEIIEEL